MKITKVMFVGLISLLCSINSFTNTNSENDFKKYVLEKLEEIYVENNIPAILGDIVIDILQVERQAEEYNTGIIRELSYMTVHSFYHLMGEDHMEEEDKKVMRQKEENVLKELGELCK